jgi:hypothetical protein
MKKPVEYLKELFEEPFDLDGNSIESDFLNVIIQAQEDAINSMLQKHIKYIVFSSIPLDIEGSNLGITGWIPTESDTGYIDEETYKFEVEKYKSKNEKVIFKNAFLQWDNCSCGDSGYGCSHGSYVYEIDIKTKDKTYVVDCEDGDSLFFEGNRSSMKLPAASATIWDFYRACELCEIELELSDYAKNLLKINE